MKEDRLFTSKLIKSQLIDFLMLDSTNDLLIGSEVMYGTKRKLVDLLVLNNNQLTAIEIKADNDDLRRIQEQIEESKKTFDYIIVCTTTAHLEKTKQLLGNDIGIYCFNEKGIDKIRKPKKQKKLDKTEILYSISANFLKKDLPTSASKINSDEVRKQYIKKSADKIHTIFVDYVQRKFQSKYELFLLSRGKYTLIDDIPLLSSSAYIQ